MADFGCVIHAVLMVQASRKLATWWEHVDSKANIADGGTRADFSTVQRFGIHLQELPHPPWPADVAVDLPSAHARESDRSSALGTTKACPVQHGRTIRLGEQGSDEESHG